MSPYENHEPRSIDDASSDASRPPPLGVPSQLSTDELRRSLEAGWSGAARPSATNPGGHPSGAGVSHSSAAGFHPSGAGGVSYAATVEACLSGASPPIHISSAAPPVMIYGGGPRWGGAVYDESEASSSPPLKLIHIGPSLVRAGIEIWLKGLSRFLDPGRLQLTRCLATHAAGFDPQLAAELSMPADVVDREGARRAAAECDVLFMWGPTELSDWLKDCRPALTVFVAHGEGPYTRAYLEACGPIVDHVVAVSRRVQERVADGYPTTVIPNGVDASHLARSLSRSESRARFGFGAEDFVVGYVGRFSPEKRAHRVIEAVARLPRNVKALLVGWGTLQPELLELANRLIPGRFALTVGKGCIGDHYEAMDALCMVSAEEGYPLVVLEAMMCGRPVIATNVGGVPDLLIDRVNGLVVSGDVDSIRAAVLLLQDHPEWARGLAAEAREVANERGHARGMARAYEDLVHRLWREKTQPRATARNGRSPAWNEHRGGILSKS